MSTNAIAPLAVATLLGTSVLYLLQYALCATFVGWSYALAFTPTFTPSQHRYQNLHPMEYPLVPDLSIVAFKTPALPARLASTWEILRMLHIDDPNAKAEFMIYPTIETTTSMKNWLSYRAQTSNSTCTACNIQDKFTVSNAFLEKQTQYYCPTRGENLASWEARTKQNKVTDKTYDDSSFGRLHKFHSNSEHAETCRASRIPSMFLAHVATNIFTLFSSHNTVILFLYTATVNALFSGAIPLYMWYSSKLGDTTLEEHMKRELHGLFSVLFCILIPVSISPILIDYYHRSEHVTVEGTEEHSNRAIGSYILGAWTLLFSFVYIGVLPSLGVQFLSTQDDEEDGKKANSFLDVNPDSDVLDCLATHQPLITFAYWNLLQTPCIVMILLATNSYGIDLYMQFVIYGSIAIGLLDVVNARVTMIIRIIYKLNPDPTTEWIVRALVTVAFVFMHLIIAVAVYIKLTQMNLQILPLISVVVLFMTQTIQNIGLLLWEYMQITCMGLQSKHTKYNASLAWHELVSTIVFVVVYLDKGSIS